MTDHPPTVPDEIRRRIHLAEARARETATPELPGTITENLDPVITIGRGFRDHIGRDLSSDASGVTRAMLLERGRNLSPGATERELTEFLWLVNAWGYGKSGFGPSRTHKVVEVPDQAFETSARAVITILNEGDRDSAAVEAYYYLNNEGHVLGWGPAFFTKFLAFADPANQADSNLSRSPALILDRWMAAAVNHYLPQPYSDRRAGRRHPLGRYRQHGWTTPQYAYYLALVDHLGRSSQFANEPWRGRPMAIERVLFHYFRDGAGRHPSASDSA